MSLQSQELLKEIEDIKIRLIHLELNVVGAEKPDAEDRKAVKEALSELKNGKTIPFFS